MNALLWRAIALHRMFRDELLVIGVVLSGATLGAGLAMVGLS